MQAPLCFPRWLFCVCRSSGSPPSRLHGCRKRTPVGPPTAARCPRTPRVSAALCPHSVLGPLPRPRGFFRLTLCPRQGVCSYHGRCCGSSFPGPFSHSSCALGLTSLRLPVAQALAACLLFVATPYRVMRRPLRLLAHFAPIWAFCCVCMTFSTGIGSFRFCIRVRLLKGSAFAPYSPPLRLSPLASRIVSSISVTPQTRLVFGLNCAGAPASSPLALPRMLKLRLAALTLTRGRQPYRLRPCPLSPPSPSCTPLAGTFACACRVASDSRACFSGTTHFSQSDASFLPAGCTSCALISFRTRLSQVRDVIGEVTPVSFPPPAQVVPFSDSASPLHSWSVVNGLSAFRPPSVSFPSAVLVQFPSRLQGLSFAPSYRPARCWVPGLAASLLDVLAPTVTCFLAARGPWFPA
jgi:hypothetical protein